MYLYMETTKMYNEPKISDERCLEISKDLGIVLLNQKTCCGDKLVIKQGRKYIDSVYNFTDSRYLDVVNQMKGNVLILGLGMGCNIIRSLEKTEINSLTVIEIHPQVISLFYTMYGTTFKGHEKLNIVNMDAFDFKEIDFDHVFIDIYNVQFDREIYFENMALLKQRYKDSIVHFIEIYNR